MPLALQQVQRDRAVEGLGIKVWDACHPLAVQQRMWDAIRDLRYVSDPATTPAGTPSAPPSM
ncbi:hypothetical protein [Vulcanococcus limneticus]|uniref:hypothetical protein n=1 Tax=Vulcanococcus limneticus TaxID=2170428 RepID=UPI0012FF86D8|nr:hypothetical protein [Vulcanococcus limneticus]MCP9792352.1 hypothetical protein [Vulcanococcus limneticus MW73D5]MCP9894072.1 hypothetical protein [Vulcanococcus limneticus Candia 3F8]MCP9897746.1 hypothetical protein [Vulcanococcus limneticus Candia 3B3]